MKTKINEENSDTTTWIGDGGAEAKAHSLATINAIADTVYRYLDFNTLVERTADVILEYIPVSSVALSRSLARLHAGNIESWQSSACWRQPHGPHCFAAAHCYHLRPGSQ